MRTDATIDRKQVRLPNAYPVGYCKYTAQFGDVIIFKENYPMSGWMTIGRVIGRIKSAPRRENDGDCRGWLVVVALGTQLDFPMERWVNPADVVECFDPQNNGGRDVAAFLSFFFGADFRSEKTDTLRQWSNYGLSDFAQFKQVTQAA